VLLLYLAEVVGKGDTSCGHGGGGGETGGAAEWQWPQSESGGTTSAVVRTGRLRSGSSSF
jgi:hypothetical protein